MGGAVTGKGADLLIIDDPHSEQEAKIASFKPEVKIMSLVEKIYIMKMKFWMKM